MSDELDDEDDPLDPDHVHTGIATTLKAQSDEIRFLSERNAQLAEDFRLMEIAWEIACDELVTEQECNDDLTTKLFWALSLNCALALVVGWLLL